MTPTKTDRDISAEIDQIQDREHFVHFYDKDAHLADGVARFFSSGFAQGQLAILIATPEHLQLVDSRLTESGVNLDPLKASGLYLQLDAEETLSQFMVGGRPSSARFHTTVGKLIMDASKRGAGIRAFGEMVALLWKRGQTDAAIELESLWNNLGKVYDFSLYCAYPFDVANKGNGLADICCQHSRSIGLVPKTAGSAH
jgi:hypothetical protein